MFGRFERLGQISIKNLKNVKPTNFLTVNNFRRLFIGSTILSASALPFISEDGQLKEKSLALVKETRKEEEKEGEKRMYSAWDDAKRVLTITNIILAINIGVFACWKIPRLVPLMETYFTSSYRGVVHYKRYASVLLSNFSHQHFLHLGFNMFLFYQIGNILEKFMGPVNFTSFFVSTGIISTAAGLLWPILSRNPMHRAHALSTASLGASGCVYGLFAIFASLFPNSRFKLFFVIDMSAEQTLAAACAFELAGMAWVLFRHSPLGHACHFTGLAMGLLYFKLFPPQRRIPSNRQRWVSDI